MLDSQIWYNVRYFDKGVHSKNFEDLSSAVTAFEQIPAKYSPQLKKIELF